MATNETGHAAEMAAREHEQQIEMLAGTGLYGAFPECTAACITGRFPNLLAPCTCGAEHTRAATRAEAERMFEATREEAEELLR